MENPSSSRKNSNGNVWLVKQVLFVQATRGGRLVQVGGLSLTAAGRLRLLLDGEQLRQPNAPIASHRPPLSLRCQDNARHKLSSELPLPGEEKSSSLKREREKVEDCGSCAMDLLSSGREAGGRKRRILVGTRRETFDPNRHLSQSTPTCHHL